jgi:chloramphenicol 3-O-phosphotransferase
VAWLQRPLALLAWPAERYTVTSEPISPETARLILITGIMAAGKSSVAQALAERLPRSVHLRGDLFRRMIINGRAGMDFELSAEALAQLQLRYRLAAAAAGLYLDAGFSVVYQDIIIGKGLDEVMQLYRRRPLHVVVLCPDPATVASREAGRPKKGYSHPAFIEEFDRVLRRETPRVGYWLDSSNLTVRESVDEILAHLPQAQVFYAPPSV